MRYKWQALVALILLLTVFLPVAQAQQTSPDSMPGCIYNATPPTLTDRQVVPWQCDINGKLIASATASSIVGALTGCSVSGDVLYSTGSPEKVACTTVMTYSNPTSAVGTLTIDTSTRTKSNGPILGNNSIVVKNSAFGTGSINIYNPGDTSQPSNATLDIRGGSDGSMQIFTNFSHVYPLDYVASQTYSIGQVVNCAAPDCAANNGFVYTSKINGNVGNDPTVSSNWKTISTVSAVAGVDVYNDPLQNWNGMELGQGGLQLWIGPKSAGATGGEVEPGISLPFLRALWDDVNHYPELRFQTPTNTYGVSGIYYVGRWFNTPASGTQIMALITEGAPADGGQLQINASPTVTQPAFQILRGGGPTFAFYNTSTDVQLGTVTNHPVGFYTNNGGLQLTMAVDGGTFIGTSSSLGSGTLNVQNAGAFGGTLSAVLAQTSEANMLCYNSTTHLFTYSTIAQQCTVSSERYKKDIAALSSDALLSAVGAFNLVSFKYKDVDNLGDERHLGLLAEQVAEIMPELVVNDFEGRPNAIKQTELVFIALGAIKSLKAELDELKRK
jgi:hypothetical protein